MKPALKLAALAMFLLFLASPGMFEPLLRPLAPEGASAIYDRASLLSLTLSHLGLVLAAILPASLVAIALAALVSRPSGEEFLPLSRALTDAGQTFPPVAVLALTVPFLGFGGWPTILALFLYGLLPIFENALAGFRTLSPAARTAALAMGLSPGQRLLQVELPLAAPLIVEGIRISTVIAVSTATIGSTVAARSLGEVIIAGLNTGNPAFVAQGGILTAALALLLFDLLGRLGERLRHG